MSVINLIKSCPLFYEILDSEIESILATSKVSTYNLGEYIIREGDEAQSFFFILSGKAQVTRMVRGEEKPLIELNRGDIFGETILINEKVRLSNVRVLAACDVLIITQDSIFNLFKKNNEVFSILMLNLARMLANRLQRSQQAIARVHESVSKSDRKAS